MADKRLSPLEASSLHAIAHAASLSNLNPHLQSMVLGPKQIAKLIKRGLVERSGDRIRVTDDGRRAFRRFAGVDL